MTPDEYQRLSNRTAPIYYENMKSRVQFKAIQEIIHAKLGIDSESGELADTIKKCLIYNQSFDVENIVEECGDILWYIALMLKACDCTIEQCMQRNIDKLKIRYPEKFSEQDALERKDKQQT